MPHVLYDVDHGVVMEPKQEKLASSQIDFGYTEQFYIPGVTSVFFWSARRLHPGPQLSPRKDAAENATSKVLCGRRRTGGGGREGEPVRGDRPRRTRAVPGAVASAAAAA